MKTFLKILGVVFVLFVLLAIWAGNDPRVQGEVEAKERVRLILKSPDSAEFQSVTSTHDGKKVCGYVSAVNMFGVRLAPMKFFYDGTVGMAFVAEGEDASKIVRDGCLELL